MRSNIALVKYWGKYGQQLPQNPLSVYPLQMLYYDRSKFFSTRTTSGGFWFFVWSKKQLNSTQIQQFLDRINPISRFAKPPPVYIEPKFFPHSSGIASSASAMAALALCIVDFEKQFHNDWTDEAF